MKARIKFLVLALPPVIFAAWQEIRIKKLNVSVIFALIADEILPH